MQLKNVTKCDENGDDQIIMMSRLNKNCKNRVKIKPKATIQETVQVKPENMQKPDQLQGRMSVAKLKVKIKNRFATSHLDQLTYLSQTVYSQNQKEDRPSNRPGHTTLSLFSLLKW